MRSVRAALAAWSRGDSHWLAWVGLAVVMLAAPVVFRSSLAHALLTQMGIAIIACLSYNMLLGQGGMLSFGHAAFSGLGAFLAIHTLRRIGDDGLALPVSLVPLAGAVAGLALAALLGWLMVRRASTPFAMISLGLGELVWAGALMFPSVFGGDAGITANRVVGPQPLGINYASHLQLYALVAVYTFASVALMYGFTRTPLGRMLNAVRDNPQRAAFVGYDPRVVRYIVLGISAAFAGLSGGLAALHLEIVTTEALGAARSAGYLLFTFVGGITVFIGPIIGGVLMVLAFSVFSELTRAWLLYLGLIFLLMVMYAPGGVASLVLGPLRLALEGRLRGLWCAGLALAGAASAALLGAAVLIELLYHRHLGAALGPLMHFMGVPLDTRSVDAWLGAALLLASGGLLLERVRRSLAPALRAAQRDVPDHSRQPSDGGRGVQKQEAR